MPTPHQKHGAPPWLASVLAAAWLAVCAAVMPSLATAQPLDETTTDFEAPRPFLPSDPDSRLMRPRIVYQASAGPIVLRKSAVLLDVAFGIGVGLGGWTDQAYTSTGTGTYKVQQHSVLSGFLMNVSVMVHATGGLYPMLRVGFGLGDFSYAQPGRNPEGATTFDSSAARENRVAWGRFTLGLGLHLETEISNQISFYLNVGGLLVVPFTEEWKFVRQNAAGEQKYETDYDLGIGGFSELGVLVNASPEFAFRIGLIFEAAFTSFSKQVRKTGSGSYAGNANGTVNYDDGDFADETTFTNGVMRRHKSASDGFRGVVGCWGVMVGVQLRI